MIRINSFVASGVGAELRFQVLWYGIGFSMLVMVTVLSLMPVSGDVGVNDKLIHLLVYACLSGWFSLIVRHRRSLIGVFIGLVVFGLLIEFLQGLTEYRSAELADAIANSIGVFIGMGIYFTPLYRLMRKFDAMLLRFLQ
ncbi:MAG: VanZ family protein [Gammaproteobacteria bacterium]|nr:VanZ family protein [Gammaproteobacteria bacterium]